MTKKTSEEEALAWAKEAYRKLKESKNYKFKSKLEQKVATLLEELGVSYEYESNKVPYIIQHHYIPDFVLPNHVYLETKGYWDPKDRRKILAVMRDNPSLDLRMVFQAPYNTISKKSKTTYAMWCEKHAIPWTSYHNIPLDWLI
jgi:predicted nuclease of restriction endonuclease-like RecB superfamily